MIGTLRCKHCGADYLGGRCGNCGSDEFVDVEEMYTIENLSMYRHPVGTSRHESDRTVRVHAN